MEEQYPTQPLDGIRVIDLTHGISGPYCTKLLACYGASVLKIERPDVGDYSRTMGPFPDDIPHPEKSGLFLFLNTDKKSVTIDLKSKDGVELLKEWVKESDILVENFRPGVMENLGIDYDTLSEINPNLIMTSISNFGQTGPYRDYVASELTLFAMGGGMHTKGLPERHPLKLGGNHVQYQAGNNAAMASLFAWYGQQYGGISGQHIDVSIFETQMASYNARMPALVSFQYTGERSQRLGGMRMGYPSGLYPCQDGYVLITGGGAFWPRTVAMLDMPELLEDPRFCPPNGQNDLEAKEEFEGTIWLPWVLERTKREIVEACQENEILSGAVNTIDDVVENNPQAQFRKYWITLDHPEIGSLQYPGAPVQTQDHWWQSSKSAPLLGQHNTEITEGTPERFSPATQPRTNKQTKSLPLEGIRVLDITLVFAGPYGTMFLADMGAEVIRVESVNVFPTSTRGAFARPTKESEAKAPQSRYPNRDPGERPWNRVAMFNAHSRNKHSMTADLNTPEGREVFRKLVEVSDVFVENIATGAMKRLGIDWPVLKEWNPRLIMISSTGMGQTGPWSGFRGFGSHFEALLGHASVTGYRDMDPEGAPSSVAADAAAGVAISTAAVLGLHQREKTGKGAHIDLAQGENFMPHLGEIFMDYMINKRVAGPPGNHDPLYVQGAYRCLGDDEWIAISLSDIDQWRRLCNFMNKPELIEDERFLDFRALQNSHDEVDKIIGEWTAAQESVTLFHVLQKEGIACGPIMHEELAYADPHLKSRNFFVPITHPEIGTHLYPSTTYKMSKIPFNVRKSPVRLGEDNDYIYREVLKLSEDEYDHLKSLGQIGMDYAPHIR